MSTPLPGFLEPPLYIKHNVVFKRSSEQIPMSFLLAFTEWYEQCPEKNYLLYPVTLWSPDFVCISEASFLPICRIARRCMQLKTPMNFPETIQWKYCYSNWLCKFILFRIKTYYSIVITMIMNYIITMHLLEHFLM